MANIVNRSSHPIEVKKIKIEVWTLRDEIEAAIMQAAEENGGDVENTDISLIKEFYSNIGKPPTEESEDPESDENLDSAGNPIDDDAAAMMAALAGGDDDESDDTEDKPAEEVPEDDADAAAMAAEMLGEQGGASTPEEDAAAAMAAEMLGDQGGGATPEEDAAAAMAAEMLGDQGGADSPEEPRKAFKRIEPHKSKKAKGFIFLSDINMAQALFFTMTPFTRGGNIIIKFKIPHAFTTTGEVVSCHNFTQSSRIISTTKPNNRLQVSLNYLFEGERGNLREFLQSIEPDIPPSPKRIKKPEDGDDDFDDLGF